MGRISISALAIGRPVERPRPRDYLTDGTNLYCVEELFEEHALVEDCRTGVLIDISTRTLLALEPVKSAGISDQDGPGAEEVPA